MGLGGSEVECFSGHTYAERPRAFTWEKRRYLVTCIERRWRTPDGPVFRVATDAGDPFEVRYKELEREWSIQPLVGAGPHEAAADT
jgi:hypothetical protein